MFRVIKHSIGNSSRLTKVFKILPTKIINIHEMRLGLGQMEFYEQRTYLDGTKSPLIINPKLLDPFRPEHYFFSDERYSRPLPKSIIQYLKKHPKLMKSVAGYPFHDQDDNYWFFQKRTTIKHFEVSDLKFRQIVDLSGKNHPYLQKGSLQVFQKEYLSDFSEFNPSYIK